MKECVVEAGKIKGGIRGEIGDMESDWGKE